ncbi:MAG: BACON domain-containing carbohydrate-binding protein, partial [Rikenellaceae bacterium]
MNIRLILKRSAQLLLVPMFAFLVGCSEQDPDAITVGSVSATEGGDAISVLLVSADGGKYTVYPSTDTWSVVSSAAWCVAQRDKCETYDSDKSLELYIYSASDATYGMEDGDVSRVATVTFTYGAASYMFLVAQGKSDDYIVFYPDAATVGYDASTVTVPLLSSVESKNLTINSSASWAQASLNSDDNVEIDYDENPSEESREAVITVNIVSTSDYSNPVSNTFTLTQEGRNPAYVTASISEYTFAAATDLSYDATLSSNISGVTYSATSNQTWCTPTISGETLTLTADANTLTSSRDAATVTITAKSSDGTVVETTTITVYQVGVDMPSISIGTTSYTYGAAALDSETISFSAVGTVTYGVGADWLTVSDAANDGVKFSLAANGSSAARTTTITITATQGGESVSETITITQEYEVLVLDVTPSVVEVYADGEAIVFTAATNGTVEWIE